MDLVRLRQILGPFIEALKDLETHERLGSLCERLGLPNPDVVGSKRDRMRSSFAALADEDLAQSGNQPAGVPSTQPQRSESDSGFDLGRSSDPIHSEEISARACARHSC